MTNEVSIFKEDTAVATAEPRQSMLAEKIAKSATTFRRIQTNTNGTFKRLIDGEQMGDAVRGEMDVIIVNQAENISRIFYKDKYDPEKEATLPNCWSNDGIKPEAAATDPQSVACISCPQNVKGSGDGADRRACRFQRRIALLLAGDESGEVYQLNIPAKSLFGKGTGNTYPYEGYYKFLRANNEAPDTVVTTVSYNLNADSMELLFSPVRTVTDAEWELVQRAQIKPETEMYTQLVVAQTDGVTKTPETITVDPASAEKPKLIEDPPKKKAKTKTTAKAAAPVKELADTIKEWEEE